MSVRILESARWPVPAFSSREAAGARLAQTVAEKPDPDALVLALPRGGVPVAAPVARAFECELRPIAVRKLPLPDEPEMGFGAVTIDGTVTLNHEVMRAHGVSMGSAAIITEHVVAELRRRAGEYPGADTLPQIAGRRVYVIDDGLATGYTAISACEMVRQHAPESITVAVPVAPMSTIDVVSGHCDQLVCLIGQEVGGFAVAAYYATFPDLSDDDVLAVLGAPLSGSRRPSAE